MIICRYESGGSGLDGGAGSHLTGLAGRGQDRAAHGVSRGSDPGDCRGAEQPGGGGAPGHAPGDGQQVAGARCAGGGVGGGRRGAATVAKWRGRLAGAGVGGLRDASRSGKPRQYEGDHERRILAALDEPPPAGYGRWDGRLLTRHLGDISKHQIWRVLRRHEISLARRRRGCICTDPGFAQEAADIVGVFLQPPENAMVFSVDEKPHIQALERAQGWLKLPDGKAVTGFSHAYKRHGTTTLFAALDIATGLVKTGHYQRRRRIEFLDFMNRLVAEHAGREIHVILDNLNTHKPKDDLY